MISRIRAAIGSSPGAHTAGVPPVTNDRNAAVVEPRSEPRLAGDSVSQFCLELEKIGGRTARVQSPDQIRQYVAGLLPNNKQPVVAVSNGVAERGAPIHEWLLEQGVRIVPSLREFSARPDNGDGYKAALLEADLGITSADFAIADTGTLVLVSGAEQHRLISLVPPVHLCLLDPGNILPDLASLIKRLRDESFSRQTPPGVITFITGSSRTADIELTLTLGVHGPRELHVLIL